MFAFNYLIFINPKAPINEQPIISIIFSYSLFILFIPIVVISVMLLHTIFRYIFTRIGCYIALASASIKSGYKMKLGRPPFASLLGIKKKEDIRIISKDKTYCIHFIDIIGRNRVFTILDSEKYIVSKTVPDAPTGINPKRKGRTFSRMYASIKSCSIDEDMHKSFPNFGNDGLVHIIFTDPIPMESVFIEDNVRKLLYSGYSVGNINYYERKQFAKFLCRT